MIYVSSACIRENSIAKVLRTLGLGGISNIELSGGTEYYENIIDDLKLFKQAGHLNYSCHGYFPPPKHPFVVNLASCNDSIYQKSIEYYDRCIEMMKHIGSKTLSVHAGFLVEIDVREIGSRINKTIVYDEDRAYDRFVAAYEHIRKLCDKNDIRLFLENNVLSAENYAGFGNHNYMMMTDYVSIMRMKKILDFDLLLDLGHLHVSANALRLDYGEECRRLKEYVKWIHISENNGVCDEHKPLREGSRIMEEFSKLYYDPLNVTLETVGNISEILTSIEILKKHMVYAAGEQ